MCAYYAATALKIAGEQYLRHRMNGTQVPAGHGADYVVADDSGQILTPRQWIGWAEEKAAFSWADLPAQKDDMGTFEFPPSPPKEMGAVPAMVGWYLVVAVVTVVAARILTTTALGFFEQVAPNLMAQGAFYDIAIDALDEASENCERYEDPAERERCLLAVANQAEELIDIANNNAQENSIIPTLAVGGLGLGTLAVAGAVGIFYLNTRKR